MNSPLKKIGFLQVFLSLGIFFLLKSSVIAGEPTFFFSALENCSQVESEIIVPEGIEQELYLCIDGSGEGQGLMGAEAQVSYDSSAITISEINCNAFDTCINLSSTGTINLLGISGAAPDGSPLTHIDKLGSFKLTANSISINPLSFSVARVINSDQDVESRTGVSFSVESIEAEEVEEEVEEEEGEEGEEEDEEANEEENSEEEDEASETEENEENSEEEENQNNENQGGGNYENLESITLTVLNSTGTPGQEIQIISSANYLGERESENITSCFPCPTQHNNSDGTTNYEVIEGPGSISFSRVRIDNNANENDQIRLRASYFDNLSQSSVESNEVTITVRRPVIPRSSSNNSSNSNNSNQEEEAEDEIEEIEEELLTQEEVIEVIEIEEEIDEGLILEVELEPLEGAVHNSANEEEVVKNVTETAEVASSEPLQEVADVEIPAEPDVDLCAVGYKSTVDSDQDGLSDRTECYIKTEINIPDTDGDGCWDGDELNLFYSNPLIKNDCSIKKLSRESVVITDPEPGWTVKSFDISGIAPRSSEDVSITIFPAHHRYLNPVVEEYEDLVNAIPNEDDNKLIERKRSIVQKIIEHKEFQNQKGLDLRNEKIVLEKVEKFLNEGTVKDKEKTNDFHEQLKEIHVDGIFLGTVENLKQSGVGKEIVSGFDLNPNSEIEDGLYDLVAVARFGNETLASSPVQIKLERNLEVDFPKPQSLDGVLIKESNYWHESSKFALEELSQRNFTEVKIENQRPILFGQTVYGAQIFATWESLALASSIIADSSEGNFSIQAPRELDPKENHQVTFYAVTQQDGKKIRSDNVIITFSIEEEINYKFYAILGSSILLTLILSSALIFKIRKKKKIRKEVERKNSKKERKGKSKKEKLKKDGNNKIPKQS